MTGCAEIAQRLCDMFRGQSPGSLKLKNKAVFHEQIGKEAAEECTVFIAHFQRSLLFNR